MGITVQQRVKAITQGRDMTATQEHLMILFMREGITFIAEQLGVSVKSAHEKCKGAEGFKLDQIATLMDALGLQIIDKNYVAVPDDEYEALVSQSRKYFELTEKSLQEKKKNHLKPVG